MKPIIFDPKIKKLSEIKKRYKPKLVIDSYKQQLEDLFLVRNPKYRFNKNYKDDFELFIKKHSNGRKLEECGKWVYFPWNRYLIHYLDNNLHQEIRFARNKNLITKEEQEKFYSFKVGVAGLSVGSHAATIIALTGGSEFMKLADPDIISPSNLNRMYFDFSYVGIKKLDAVSRYIYQLNPYAKLKTYPGLNEDNLSDFLDGLDIVVEELDNIKMKLKIREMAKKKKIPVIMATDNGDGVILDIERFDLNPNYPVFHGRLKGFNLEDIDKNTMKLYEAMAKIIDLSLVPSRALNSVLEVGKSIYSWPQLGTAAILSGVIIAYAVRQICLGNNLKSGKIDINLDYIINREYYKKDKKLRLKIKKVFLKKIGIR
jgi:molybdopterin/thiamine biosynthesis adenylyltransferase